MSKPRLGRGLSALIPTTNTTEETKDFQGRKVLEISIEKVKPNPMQPRREFDQQKLLGMAETIKKFGVIQPILVVESDDSYIIVAGERRFRAAILAGLKTIPAEIKEYTKEQYTEIALIENLQREDLNPIEEALAYKKLIEEFNLTQDEVAKRLGRSRSTISNTMRLLSLPDDIRRDLIAGKLTPGQVRPILSIKDESEQIAYAAKIIDDNLSARQVEKIIQTKKNNYQQKNKSESKNRKENDIELEILKEMEDNLRKYFGTKVLIKTGIKEGKIEISFYNNEDLNRLMQLLMK